MSSRVSRFLVAAVLFALAAPIGSTLPTATASAGTSARAQAGTVTIERERFLMGTRCTILLQGGDPAALDAAATAAFDEIARLEAVASNWSEESELSRFHRAAEARPGQPIPVSADLFDVIARGKAWTERTRGAFDATVEPLTRAYDLRGEGRIPGAEERRNAAALVGGKDVRLDATARTITLPKKGMAFDLSGIAKGWAIDRAVTTLRARGVERALLNLGGQVYGLGSPVGADAWTVELASPTDRARGVTSVRLHDQSVSTTAASERSLEVSGRVINHVLDPRTGQPATSWGAACAIAPSATDADCASTALYVLGADAARAWIASQTDIEAVLLVDDATADGGVRIERADRSATAVLVAAPADAADTGTVPDNTELARRIDVLSNELEDMKLGEVAKPAGASKYGLGPAASKVYGVPRGVSIGGYGEMLYENFGANLENDVPSGSRDRIDFLRAVVYAGYKFSDKVLFNSEIEFEHATTEIHGSVSVEFAYLDFLLQPQFNVRAGMVLPPLGFINEMHEPPTFLGARRPDVERLIIPSTWRTNGLGIFGESDYGLSYRIYVVEGLRGVADPGDNIGGFDGSDGIREGRQAGSEARAEQWGLTGRLEYARSGATVAASLYTGGSAQGDTTATGEDFSGKTTIWELHAEYKAKGVWLRALYAGSSIEEAEIFNDLNGLAGDEGVGSRQFGWYGELGYDILRPISPNSTMSLYPYVRYEQYDTQKEVPSGFLRNPANERTVLTAGAAFYPHTQVSVKTDYQWRTNEAETGLNQFNVNLGYLF
ncbi:MAG: FAD:protein FMN transferase [Candidatus Eiseniibacteriota bacterium]